MASRPPLTIVGAGAIGGIVGAALIRAGHAVTFVEANAEHAAAIRAEGLTLTGATEAVVRPAAVLAPAEVEAPLGRVLLAVKARHTLDALATIAPLLAPDGYIVSLQNGLEEYKIAAAVGPERTVGAFLTFGGHYAAPGHIVHGGAGTFRVGEIDGRITPRVEELKAWLSALQPVEATDNIFGFLWSKLALGAVYFATALVSADVVEQYEREDYRAMFGRLAAEVARVAAAEGVRCETIDGFDPTAFRLDSSGDPAAIEACWEGQRRYWGRHPGGRTGVWRDLAQHRRKTEVGEQVGAVVGRARRHAVPVPRLEKLAAMIAEAEEGRRGLVYANLDELVAFDRAEMANRRASASPR